MLRDRLAREGIPHLFVREPGGTELGEALRPVILRGAEMNPRSELLLYLAARAALVEEKILPALAAGTLVVADRFYLSSLVYQGYGRGLSLSEVTPIIEFATQNLKPDLTLVMDVPPRTSRERSQRKGPDRIESADESFHERVRAGYLELAAADAAIELVDATPGVRAIHRAVLSILGRRWPETFASASG